MPVDVRALKRALRVSLPDVETASDEAPSLEASDLPIEPPHTRACEVIEGARFERVLVEGPPVVGFTAFLDGIQASRVLAYDGAMPIVFGHAAAAIRVRIDRRLRSWGEPKESGAIYAPVALLSSAVRGALDAVGIPVIDTLRGDEPPAGEVPHPLQLLRSAVHAVQRDREGVERDCAEAWCATESSPLFVDGGLPRGDQASGSPWCVGVVKSHHTLYATGDALRVISSLGVGERSTAFRIEPTWGPAVASWYLRVRRASGRDPLWGLVRVEVALESGRGNGRELADRASTVSTWILAERAPLALPDGRWDRMAYGIRDCETFLRARTRM